MKDFAGKTAFVTGAAQGIGLGICRALAKEGVSVAMADIAPDALEAACAGLARDGARVLALPLDVSDAAAVERAAAAVAERFGAVHILVNNAGVAAPPKPMSAIPLEDWNWLVGVNLYGVIHGVRSFLPLIRKHGAGGHVVNTASIAGLQVRPGRGTGAYAATKYAVVALSESLEQELAGSGIGVSVLCPAAVDTEIYASPRRRPPRFGGPFAPPEPHPNQASLADGLSPDAVGARVIQAIRDDEFFIFTHEEPRAWIEARHRRLVEGFDRIAAYNRARGLPPR
ncbi:MAG TPA: SDR family NAD(P)-dependent oxidoreductase [Stellaceae bacterium]|nr:SDR family NAD(P)-dependent oxidoreductase [Stellaceae bacterium]